MYNSVINSIIKSFGVSRDDLDIRIKLKDKRYRILSFKLLWMVIILGLSALSLSLIYVLIVLSILVS